MSETPEINRRLRAAVKGTPAPPHLEERVRARLLSQRKRPVWALRLAPAFLAAATLAGVLAAYDLGHLRFTSASQQSYIVSVSSRVASLMRVGLGDHINCAVFRKYPQNPPKVEELITELNPQFAGLIPIVRKHVPEQYQMRLAHECFYRGRKFVHLSLMDGSNTLSLVITRKNPGESFDADGLIPALAQSGISMYQSSVQRFAMTSFETRDYLIYFISDLPQDQNTGLAVAMSEEVRDFLKRLES